MTSRAGLLASSRTLQADVHALNLIAARGYLPQPRLLAKVNKLHEQLDGELREEQLVSSPACWRR